MQQGPPYPSDDAGFAHSQVYLPTLGSHPTAGEAYPGAPGVYPPPAAGYSLPPAAGYPLPPAAGYPPPPQGAYPPAANVGYPPSSDVYPPADYQGFVNRPGVTSVPISTQPTSGDGWMSLPQNASANCPPGLEYLSTVNQLLVHQQIEILEVLTGFETENKYVVKNSLGQKVFFAAEQSDCFARCCCGPVRPFGMKITDNYGNEVIHLERPLACTSCCCPCCLQRLEVYSPPGNLVGTIEQEWSIFIPKFSIKNTAGDTVLKIEGPFCTFSICGDVEFKVLSQDESAVVGKITKQWSGLARELLTDADNFGITFPMDLDVKMKAVMLGACFLIDFMYYEQAQNNENRRH